MTTQGIWTKPIVRRLHEHQSNRLLKAIPQLNKCKHSNHLALIKYLDKIPEKFYSKEVFDVYLDFLNEQSSKNPTRLFSLLTNNKHNLDNAFANLDRINIDNWHDAINPDDQYDFIQFCDSTLNTIYSKLIDGTYHHLVFIIAAILTLDKGKSIQGLDVFNCVEVIKKKFPIISKPYDNIIRNGIAHGSVTYRHFEIIYQDKKANQRKLQPFELIDFVDSLIDACNGMALALKVFFLQNIEHVKVPQQIMLEELQAQTNFPWWKVIGFLESELPNASQLIVFASPSTRDYFKVQYSTFFSAVLCEELAPGFDRYFFSLRSPMILPGLAIFDGERLRQLREKTASKFEDYIGVMTDFVYIPKLRFPTPKIFTKLETYYYSFIIHFHLALDEILNFFGLNRFSYRDAKIHRTKLHLFLESRIVIDTEDQSDIQSVLKHSKKRLLRESLKRAKKSLGIFDRIFPLGFARLYIYKSDHRRRKLRNFGLGEDLICTIQVRKLKEVNLPDIMNSTIELSGKYRIAWNKKWLASRKS